MSLIDNTGLHRKAMRLYDRGFNDRQMAERLKLKTGNVIYWRRCHKLPSQRSKKHTIYTDLYNIGLCDEHIARIYRVAHGVVRDWRVMHDLDPNPKNNNHIVLSNILKDISWLSHSRLTTREVAEKLGINEIIVDYWHKIQNADQRTHKLVLKDTESLYCDTEFLEKFLQKQLI